MKIGIDARMYSSRFTGIGRYNHELIKNLLKIDKKNQYVIFLNQNEFPKFKIKNPQQVKKVMANCQHYSLSEQTKLLKILNKENLDLMHFTHFNAPIFYRRPFVMTIHDLTLSYFPGKKMTSVLHRLAYQLTIRTNTHKAKHIIAVSKNTKKDLTKLLKINPEKITVTYEGTDPKFQVIDCRNKLQFISTVEEKYGLNNPFLLYTGVWRDHKNVVGLIKAYAKLLNGKKFEGDLVITGRKDGTYNEVIEAVKNLQIENKVKFVGLVPEEDLIALYNLASIYVFPSFYEGFGLPPLEAMACGTPVCASNTSCIPEICGKENAVFFDPYDIENMTEKIGKLYNDNQLQKKLIQNGFKRIQDFSWEKMARETLGVYKKVGVNCN